MAISFTGATTNTVFTPGAVVQPFKTIRLLDSAASTTQSVTITVTDIKGGAPTDADGLFEVYSSFRQIAPGTYTFSSAISTSVANSRLAALNFTTGATPTTAVFTVRSTNNLNVTGADSRTQVVEAFPPTKFIVADTTTGSTYASPGTPYSGPAGVNNQYIVQSDNPLLTPDNLNIVAVTPSSFIHSGSGVDAIDVSGVGGKNVLDGGTGSNFLVGGKAGAGTDTFFVDARNAASEIWSTVVNFHAGDAVTVFGLSPSQKTIAYADGQGAAGATGLTLHATQAGAPTASFTLAGYTTADLSNGRLGVNFGTDVDGQPYMYVVGLR